MTVNLYASMDHKSMTLACAEILEAVIMSNWPEVQFLVRGENSMWLLL